MAFPLVALPAAFGFAKEIIDRIWPKQASEDEKLAAAKDLADSISKRDDQVVQASKDIIVAEMQQGDAFTKRARPMLVYAGLAFIFLVHVFIPLMVWTALVTGKTLPEGAPTLSLPSEFWYAWTSVVGLWTLGRSAERRGMTNKLIEAITGNKT